MKNERISDVRRTTKIAGTLLFIKSEGETVEKNVSKMVLVFLWIRFSDVVAVGGERAAENVF